MVTATDIGPEHEMATSLVAVPTVVSREMRLGETTLKSVFIQWYGEADSPHMPRDAQFFFDTMAGPDHAKWLGEPESFRVVFIGRIKHWPNPDAIGQMVAAANGTRETVIAWLMSPRSQQIFEPSSKLTGIALLGDSICGVIEPRLYCDLSVRDAVTKEFEDSLTLADKLVRNPRMELPPESVPWSLGDDNCPNCAPFRTSNKGRPALPPDGDYHDLTHVCGVCNRRWWQFNTFYHFWSHVGNPNEWDEIRRQRILTDAGYAPAED
jgi:hypothetical protein